ncbi:SDR family NAD(P)-dependent oxidoreductase [Pseudenhygromyxa sp. WMMC2535]|uniref:SDR family NAD(P)-dependent oxidoreductase n=1 Tax=Pseudenhygromyxa sp. WMMC2535 TaxID=2712867 RepID=UPI00155741D5|nr:SDR family NAD(P)-dependent oxidoreductase [Pseudenhygromyxa sp. WMMC2535]
MSERVLIIGATSAIAAAFARLHAQRGSQLYLIARNRERLAALVDELNAAGERVVGWASADLDALAQNAALVASAHARLSGFDLVLIAHGYLGDQLRSETDLDEALASLRTNLLSPVSLLLEIAARCEAQASGRVGVITSVAGERGRPRNYTYGAAKGGLSRYLEGVRSRLYPSGVRVYDFRLGPVDTPMTHDHPKNALFTTAERAAARIDRGFAGRGRAVYVPGFWWWIMLVVRWLPEPIFQRLSFLSGR